MRSFIAFPLSEAVKQYLSNGIEMLRRTNPEIRWTAIENLHVTALFLGSITGDQENQIAHVLDQIGASARPLRAEICGLGTFPPRGKPRVIFAEVTGGADGMKGIRSTLTGELSSMLPLDRRPFKPHITLARCRRGTPEFKPVAGVFVQPIEFTIDRLCLFESILASGGAQYILRHETHLGR